MFMCERDGGGGVTAGGGLDSSLSSRGARTTGQEIELGRKSCVSSR
jgi:hypothetical protein